MNLLIIDDDAISVFINTRLAETTGLFKKVFSVSNGLDALEFFEQASCGMVPAPDLLLLDLNMPVMSGFDFVQALGNMTVPWKERVPIVILTSSDNAVDVTRAQSLGIKHYLLKSLPPKEFQQTIFSLAAKYAADRATENHFQ